MTLFVPAGAERGFVGLADGEVRLCSLLLPVDHLLEVAELVNADLLVMPTAGHHGIFDALRGSTTERVLRRAPCPLLAVPSYR